MYPCPSPGGAPRQGVPLPPPDRTKTRGNPPARTSTGVPPDRTRAGVPPPPGQDTPQTGCAAGSTPLAVTQEDFVVVVVVWCTHFGFLANYGCFIR